MIKAVISVIAISATLVAGQTVCEPSAYSLVSVATGKEAHISPIRVKQLTLYVSSIDRDKIIARVGKNSPNRDFIYTRELKGVRIYRSGKFSLYIDEFDTWYIKAKGGELGEYLFQLHCR